jgi:hypothetical protein
MAQRHRVTVSTQTQSYRMTADERRAARVAEIAGKQGDLKREAAERRAKREREAPAKSAAPPVAPRRKVPATGRSGSR